MFTLIKYVLVGYVAYKLGETVGVVKGAKAAVLFRNRLSY